MFCIFTLTTFLGFNFCVIRSLLRFYALYLLLLHRHQRYFIDFCSANWHSFSLVNHFLSWLLYIVIDALNDFIFLGNLQKVAVFVQRSKRSFLAILEGETDGLKFLYGV